MSTAVEAELAALLAVAKVTAGVAFVPSPNRVSGVFVLACLVRVAARVLACKGTCPNLSHAQKAILNLIPWLSAV